MSSQSVTPTFICPLCDTTLDKVEVALRRNIWNSILTGLGSSQLQVYRRKTNSWQIFLKPGRDIPALSCPKCGTLTIPPSIPSHRESLGLK
ncbi:MAG: hypothetical protein OSA93_04515 [Akkermansiaceae bacterium]|nr:hypothetical protein [Akkermansiaceae bacterium]